MVGSNRTKFIVDPRKQDVFYIREFDAPRELVFRAYTDPELYAQWIGPRGLSTTIETFEPRYGGKWRFIQKDRDGQTFAFHGVFHEVKAPERIVDTFEYEGLPEGGHAVLETVKFEALPGNRTRVTVQAVHQSAEDRDGMLKAGAESGVQEGYERLDELLEKLK